MFASETVVPSRPSRTEERNSFSPSGLASSLPTSPTEGLVGDCPSPVKLEASSYFPSTSIMKLEPMSPQSGYGLIIDSPGKTRFGTSTMDWQDTSSANSLDSLSPYSPHSNGGMAGISSPLTSPLSNYSATNTMSPSGKLGRDDLSPASSVNGYSLEPVEKKKKGPSSRQSDELCLVCGDRSSGYHYNALTCEGCKGFFRRSITKNAVYVCKYGKNCEMDMYMRRKCQECRFKKCINVGMRPDCVVPEQQCKVRRDQKKTRDKDRPKEITSYARNQPNIGTPFFAQPSLAVARGGVTLTKEHQELINKLVYNQERFENPSQDIIKNVEEKFGMHNLSEKDRRYKYILEMTKLTVELIVEFARTAPGFDKLIKSDQVTLLKASTSEIIYLRSSRKYHSPTDSIVFADNSPNTKGSYTAADMDSSITDELFRFCRKMHSMNVDNAEYALLTGIAIFSERPGLTHVDTVETIQYLYVETLFAYVYNKGYAKPGLMFAKLLDVLTQIRTLGILNNVQCEKFLQNEKDLPELLAEIWDIKR